VHQGKELDDERSEDIVVGSSGIGEGVPNGGGDGGSNVGGRRLESTLQTSKKACQQRKNKER